MGPLTQRWGAQVPSLRCTGAQVLLQNQVPGLGDTHHSPKRNSPPALPGAAAAATPAHRREGRAVITGIKTIKFVAQM